MEGLLQEEFMPHYSKNLEIRAKEMDIIAKEKIFQQRVGDFAMDESRLEVVVGSS